MADIPSAPAVDLSPEVQTQIQDLSKRSMQTEPELSRATLMGVEDSSKMLQGDGFDQGLNYNGPTLSGGISRRALKKYDYNMRKLGVDTKMDSINRRMTRLTQASQMTSAEIAHNEQVKAARYAQEQHRKQARGSALGSILGVVGGVVGAIYGGPAGAMAGSAAGKGLGEAVGGS